MSTETYSLSIDFGGNLNAGQFHEEIDDESGISPTILTVRITDDVVELDFSSSLSSGEQTILDGLVSGHVPNDSKPKDNFYTVYPRLDSVRTTGYKSTGAFKFAGSNVVGNVDYIEVIAYMDEACTSYSVRVYDQTNGNVLAEATDLTNTAQSIQDLGDVSNIPSSSAVLEVQLKRVGGTYENNIYLDSVLIYHNN